MIEVTPDRFYKMGVACFSVIAIFSLINYIMNFWLNTYVSNVIGLAQVVFNFTLAGFFIYLLKTTQPTEEFNAQEWEENFKNESSNIRKGID